MRTLLACASLTLALAACGYKGPLVMPKAQPARAVAPATHPAAPAPHAEASAAVGEASAAR